jgi:hypothetical protein
VFTLVLADTNRWERCEDWTEFDFYPALEIPGVYRLEIAGDGYRSQCALVLTERTPFWDLDTNCPSSELRLRHWERALPGVVVPRRLRHVHVELARGDRVLYAGDESLRGRFDGAHRLRCEWRSTTLMLRGGDQPDAAAP